jgi:glucokinase
VAPTASGARAIVEQGLTREDETAIEALELMAGWLGRYAADMALTFNATGGIYLSGGLAANLLPLINGRHFLDELEAGIGDQLGEVSVRVVKTGADTGLRGAALALANSLPAKPSLRRATLAG